MSLSNEALRSIPLLSGMSDQQLEQFGGIFEQREYAAGEHLFRAGETAHSMYLLARGAVQLTRGEESRIELSPPTPIGELGAIAGTPRRTNARVTTTSEVWSVSRQALEAFFANHPQVSLSFYRNLVQVVADKTRRDQLRIEDMRSNLIRTQKAMKELRDYVLQSDDTAISERTHDTLNQIITHNRRANYRVAPPAILPAELKMDDGARFPIVEISRTHLSYRHENGSVPDNGRRLSGVAICSGPEIPFSGRVLRSVGQRVDLEFDLLLDEYASTLEGYLSRVQMVDFVA